LIDIISFYINIAVSTSNAEPESDGEISMMVDNILRGIIDLHIWRGGVVGGVEGVNTRKEIFLFILC